MSNIHSKHPGCRLCGSTLLQCVVPLQPVLIGEHYSDVPYTDAVQKYPIDLYQCLECGAVQSNDDIDDTFLWKDYTYYSGQTQKIVDHFKNFADYLISRFYNPQKVESNQEKLKILDIGSNDGSLLRQFKDRQFDVQGIDPAETVVSQAIKSKIPTVLGKLNLEAINQNKCLQSRFNVITAFNVFAHSSQMEEMCQAVHDLLDDSGIFCFEVQYLGDIYEKHILGTIFHEHMVHYSLHSAQSFLERHSLRIFDYQRNNIQNGSIIFFACHSNCNVYDDHASQNRISSLINYEKEEQLNNTGWSFDFVKHLIRQRNQCNQVLADFFNDIPIHLSAYGAARSGPTLAIQFAIDHYIFELFDDHPSKQNKYSPFNNLKVAPTSTLNANQHKLTVILAYIHYKNIILAHVDYLNDGGAFLLLWPSVELVTKSNYTNFL